MITNAANFTHLAYLLYIREVYIFNFSQLYFVWLICEDSIFVCTFFASLVTTEFTMVCFCAAEFLITDNALWIFIMVIITWIFKVEYCFIKLKGYIFVQDFDVISVFLTMLVENYSTASCWEETAFKSTFDCLFVPSFIFRVIKPFMKWSCAETHERLFHFIANHTLLCT